MVPIGSTVSALRRRIASDPNLSDIDRALALAFDGVSEGLIELEADGIGDTVKLIFGRAYAANHVPQRFAHYLASQALPNTLIRERLNLPQLRVLTAFYMALWQGNAFQANGDFDLDGLVSFVAHYLGESDDWTTHCLASEVGQCHFDAIKRFGPADDDAHHDRIPSICDSVGGEIALPGAIPALFASGGRYHGIYLANVSFIGTVITDVHFTESNFSGANLSFFVFDRVRFINSCIDGTLFHRGRLTAVDIDTTNAQRTTFTKCVIRDGHWSNSHFNHTGFHHTEVEALSIVACSFQAARFNGPPRAAHRPGTALFKDVSFRNSSLDAAVFSSVVASELTLDKCTCHGTTFVDNVFSALHLSAVVRGAIFQKNQFQASSFRRMDAMGSTWHDGEFDVSCDFSQANFSKSTLSRATFNGVKFDGVDFSRAKLRDIGFTRIGALANFSKADFDGATVENVIFDKCRFSQAHFLGTRFTGSPFGDCDLQGVAFRGATGLDIVSAAGLNKVARASFAGARGGLVDTVLAGLETPEGRERMLNHHRHTDCLMAKIMSTEGLAVRADWVLAIASFLERKVPGAIDADASMLRAMLVLANHPEAPLLETRVRLERRITQMLIRQMPGLNRTGLSMEAEAAWSIQAARRIAVLLSAQADARQTQRMRPLISSIIALHLQGAIHLDQPTLVGLRRARQIGAPDGVADGIVAVPEGPRFPSTSSHRDDQSEGDI